MRFIDRVRILVRAGDGGNGAVAWRREAHVSHGGPAGGDGGSGGNVVLVADEGLNTLLDLRYRQHYEAQPGRSGSTARKNGRGGDDLKIRVPVGTDVFYEGPAGEKGEVPPWVKRERERRALENEGESDFGSDEMETIYIVEEGLDAFDSDEDLPPEADPEFSIPLGERSPKKRRQRAVDDEHRVYEEGERLGELVGRDDSLCVARGGRGGRGNVHFRTSTNRAPERAEDGRPGEAHWLRLELKLLADVGIVGFPNVGKSTLIRNVSRARPEVGDYPFTTLVPQLGVVSLSNERSMVIADIPGLIEGASAGKGLGHSFLRHLERTRVLLHVLSPDPTPGREPLRDLEVLEQELCAYGSMFEGRPRVVALNKIDTEEGQALLKETKRALRKRQIPLFPICANTGEGVPALLEALWRRLEMIRNSSQR